MQTQKKTKFPKWDGEAAPSADDIKNIRDEMNEFLDAYGVKALSMAWWADAVGVAGNTWYHWEAGKREMPLATWGFVKQVIAPRIRSKIEAKHETAKDALA